MSSLRLYNTVDHKHMADPSKCILLPEDWDLLPMILLNWPKDLALEEVSSEALLLQFPVRYRYEGHSTTCVETKELERSNISLILI